MDEITDSKTARWVTFLVLASLVATAFFIRSQIITIYGGGQGYLNWATTNYYGDITRAGYLAGAHSILTGHGYSSSSYPPGYSVFLAGAQSLGIRSVEGIRLLQALIDSFALLGIYWLLRRLASPRGLALAGSGIYAIVAEWATGSTFLLAEWFVPGLLVWLLVLLVVAKEKTTLWRWSAIGLLIAFGALIRPDLLLLVFPAIVWLGLTWKQPKKTKVVGVVVLILSFLLPIGIWGVHNRLQHGEWIFLTTGGGNTLWEGLGDIKNEYGFVLNDSVAIKMAAKQNLAWHSVAADSYFKALYRKAVIAYPLYVLKVAAWRWKQIATRTAAVGIYPEVIVGLQQLFTAYVKDAAIWVWLAAMIVSWRRPVALLIVGLPLIYALISIGLVHYESRYVRYAHLSYLFAPAALLIILPRLVPERGAHWIRWTISAVAMIALLYGAIPCISHLRATAQIAELPVKAANGKLEELSSLRLMDFQHPVANHVVKEVDGSLLVQTDRSTFSYQLISQISLERAKFLYIPFQARLFHGAFAVGLLGPDNKWITQRGYATAGNVDSFIGAAVQNIKYVTLVITNYCVKPCSTEFELKNLQVYVKK
jgi:4-amino-4-deoxy-L-arabinose transferase-like glycosyltransferase